MEIRIEEEEEKCNQLIDDRKKFQQTITDLEDQYVYAMRIKKKKLWLLWIKGIWKFKGKVLKCCIYLYKQF